MTEELQSIVIDNGSYFCKVGFSNESEPRSNFCSIVGFQKYWEQVVYDPTNRPPVYAGKKACEKYGILFCRHPVIRGIIKDLDYMEKLFDYIFSDELKIDQSKHPVIITETAFNPKEMREWVTELMFEKYNVPSFYTGIDAIFSILSSGNKTGLVLESGSGVSTSVPIYEGYPIKNAMIRNPIGGVDMTHYLMNLIGESEKMYVEYIANIVNDVRKKTNYVALDFEKETQKAEKTSECQIKYQFQGGNPIIFNKERFTCPELLFKPNLNGLKLESIDRIIYNSIKKCKSELHEKLFSNIILSGGTSMLKGLSERIEKEISQLLKNEKNIKVTSHQDGNYSAWKGASIFSSLDTTKQKFMSRKEYNESGVHIIHQKSLS